MLKREDQNRLTKSSAGSIYVDFLKQFQNKVASKSDVKPKYFVWHNDPKGTHIYYGSDRESASLITQEPNKSKSRKKKKILSSHLVC